MVLFSKGSIVIKLPVKRAPWLTLFWGRIYRERGSQFDENMKKYNEDNVNYANSKRRVFKVGIM